MNYEPINWDYSTTPLNPDNLNKMDNGIKELYNRQEYSENEKIIGKWIDGKNVYRRVFYMGFLPNNSVYNFSTDILNSNIKFIIKYYGFAIDTSETSTKGNQIFANNVREDANLEWKIILDRLTNYLGLRNITNSDRSKFESYAIIEYIKTND